VKLLLDDETLRALRHRLRAAGWGWLDRSSEAVWASRFVLRISRALEGASRSEEHALAKRAFEDAFEDAALRGAIVPITPEARAVLDRLRRALAKERRAMMGHGRPDPTPRGGVPRARVR
jgi:hypothetical protein